MAPTPRTGSDASERRDEPPLRDCVARAVRRYLVDLDGHGESDLFRLVMAEVEGPLIAEVMRHCDDNQTRAAEILGLTRATLRKKLAQARPLRGRAK